MGRFTAQDVAEVDVSFGDSCQVGPASEMGNLDIMAVDELHLTIPNEVQENKSDANTFQLLFQAENLSKEQAQTEAGKLEPLSHILAQCKSAIRFMQGFKFNDPLLERRYLRYVSRQGMSMDSIRFLAVGTAIAIHTQQARTSQCDDLATKPCPVGFWVLRAVLASYQIFLGLALLVALRWKAWQRLLLTFYQEILLVLLIVDALLMLAGSSMRELHMRNEKRCPDNPTACPNQHFTWVMVPIIASYLYFVVRIASLTLRYAYGLCAMTMLALLALAFPWYSQQDEVTGKSYTVNHFEPGGVVMGYLYLLLVTLMSLRCKQTQEVLSRHMFTRTRFLQSQQSSITALLQQYIPERLKLQSEADPRGLIMEKFPAVTILFCSFDKASVRQYMEHHDVHDFFTTFAGIVVDFDLLLENPNLFKLENVGQDYLVTSSVVKRGISRRHPDTHEQQVLDAVALVHMAQEMMHLRSEYRDNALAEESSTLDFKVGLHSGSCVGAVAGVQRRFYRLFGDTINTAARMCSHSSLGTIWLSEKTNRLLENTDVQTELHGNIHVKGKGKMDIYQVLEPLHSRLAELDGFPSARIHEEEDCSSSASTLADLHSLESSLNRKLENASEDTFMYMNAFAARYPRMSQGARGNDSRHRRQSVESDTSDSREKGLEMAQLPALTSPSHGRVSLSTEASSRQGFIRKQAFIDLFRDHSYKSASINGFPEDDEEVVQESRQFHKLTGQFLDAESEAAYQEHIVHDMQREHEILLSIIIVSMLFMHAYMYFQNEYNHHSRSHQWIFVIASFAAAVQTTVLFCLLRRRLHPQGSQELFKFAYIASFVALVPLVLVIPTRYSWMGFMLLLYLNPAYSCASMAVVLAAVVSLSLILFIPVLFLDGSLSQLSQSILAALVFPAIVIMLRRAFFVHSRIAWQVERKLSNQRLKLAGLLYDLVPSVSACTFVLRQHQDVHRLDDQFLIFRKDLLWVAPLGTYACVLSTDLVDFTPLANNIGAEGVVHLLHDLWCIMDQALQSMQDLPQRRSLAKLLEKMGVSPLHSFSQPQLQSKEYSQLRLQETGDHQVLTDASGHMEPGVPFKIDTVGDAYMVAMMFDHPSAHIEQQSVLEMMRLAKAISIKVLEYSRTGPYGTEPGSVKMRMGMCLGKAASGLVGLMKPRYHIVGDPLQLAAELESRSRAFHVNVDQHTADCIHSDELLIDLSQ